MAMKRSRDEIPLAQLNPPPAKRQRTSKIRYPQLLDVCHPNAHSIPFEKSLIQLQSRSISPKPPMPIEHTTIAEAFDKHPEKCRFVRLETKMRDSFCDNIGQMVDWAADRNANRDDLFDLLPFRECMCLLAELLTLCRDTTRVIHHCQTNLNTIHYDTNDYSITPNHERIKEMISRQHELAAMMKRSATYHLQMETLNNTLENMWNFVPSLTPTPPPSKIAQRKAATSHQNRNRTTVSTHFENMDPFHVGNSSYLQPLTPKSKKNRRFRKSANYRKAKHRSNRRTKRNFISSDDDNDSENESSDDMSDDDDDDDMNETNLNINSPLSSPFGRGRNANTASKFLSFDQRKAAMKPNRFWNVFDTYFKHPKSNKEESTVITLVQKPTQLNAGIPPLPTKEKKTKKQNENSDSFAAFPASYERNDSRQSAAKMNRNLKNSNAKETTHLHSQFPTAALTHHSMAQRMQSMTLPETCDEWWFDRSDDTSNNSNDAWKKVGTKQESMDNNDINTELIQPIVEYATKPSANAPIASKDASKDAYEDILRSEICSQFFGGNTAALDKILNQSWQKRTDDECCAWIREAGVDLNAQWDESVDGITDLISKIKATEKSGTNLSQFEEIINLVLKSIKRELGNDSANTHTKLMGGLPQIPRVRQALLKLITQAVALDVSTTTTPK